MAQTVKTGESLYAEHSAKNPIHANGIPRKSWDQLTATTQNFWNKKAIEANVLGKKTWN